VWLLRLAGTKARAEGFVRAGLFYVNTEICVNPDYRVKAGDVITMNPEAYWDIKRKKIARVVEKK